MKAKGDPHNLIDDIDALSDEKCPTTAGGFR